MAMNHDYYTLVHNYVLKKGMDRVDANDIATSLSVLVPLRLDIGKEPDRTYPNNAHVMAGIAKLHEGLPYTRIIPFDLGIRVIKVDSYNELPNSTTYGQLYYVRHGAEWLETKPNGFTERVQPLILLEITEPLATDPALLSRLREKAAQKGMRIEITNKSADHPDNVAGLAKLQQMFADEPSLMLKAEVVSARNEDQASWSKPTGKITFRNRPSNHLTRMRNRKRG